MGRTWVWAPRAKHVDLVLFPDGERIPMRAQPRGYYEVEHPRVRPGQAYAFALDGGEPRPDPRSQWQPEGVHGPSCWPDLGAFRWTDAGFQAVPLSTAVIYELHVGTFSPAGTFEGAIEYLPRLKSLGITHVEIMPVAHFSGSRGWGYDGVCLFAPHTAYGGPRGLQKFVDACHAQGLAVILDVVYNHLGPSGNYLSLYGPYFTSTYHTPWGDALNYDEAGSDEVRRFVCDNACHWLEHYHIDGLRLDAIHAILDLSATHVLAQMAQEVDELSARLGRHFVLIAESGLNDPRIVLPEIGGGYALHSQWSDDIHHAIHAALTGERSGYYEDYGSIEQVAEALLHGFVFRGQYSPYRDKRFGRSTAGLRGRQFVGFIQNHDQIGNRAVGDRLSATLGPDALKLAAALYLLAPFVPLVFMGEEWGSKRPFQYFTDHPEPDLAQAVREGRRREFASFGWDPAEIPDPQDLATFEASTLDWSEAERGEHAELLRWYTALLAIRHQEPSLANDRLEATSVAFDERARWIRMQRGRVILACNCGEEACSVELPSAAGYELALASGPEVVVRDTHVSLPRHGTAVLRLRG